MKKTISLFVKDQILTFNSMAQAKRFRKLLPLYPIQKKFQKMTNYGPSYKTIFNPLILINIEE